MNKYILIIFVLIINQNLLCKNNYVYIDDGYGSSQANIQPVSLILCNEDTLSGIQIQIEYEAQDIIVDLIEITDRSNKFDVYYNTDTPGILSIIIVSFDGEYILPGKGSVLNISLHPVDAFAYAAIPITITEVIFSNIHSIALGGVSIDGYLLTEGKNYLRIGNGTGIIEAKFLNAVNIAGIQGIINYSADLLSIDSIVTRENDHPLTINYNEKILGEIVFTLSNTNGNYITSGFTHLFSIYTTPKDNLKFVPIILTDVIISDTDGNMEPVIALSGNTQVKEHTIPTVNSIPVIKNNEFKLEQNFPNPFNPTTMIPFSLPFRQNVKLIIYDILGRTIATPVDGILDAGYHEIEWNAAHCASGIYFYRLLLKYQIITKKLILTK